MDTTHLTIARDTLVQHGDEWCATGRFALLFCQLPAPNVSEPESLDDIILALRAVSWGRGSMLTAIERLNWMQARAQQDQHLRSRWPEYASADIQSWHVNLRSSLDEVAKVIKKLADRPDQVSDSFHELYKKSCSACADFAKRLGADWLALIQNATWFNQILSVRDEIVHRGGQTLVFEDPSKGILFQVHGRRYQRLIVDNPPLMYNRNVVYFDRYAAHFTAHLMALLEKFADTAFRRLGMSMIPCDAVLCSPGYGVLHSWIGSLLVAIQEHAQTAAVAV